MTVHEKLSAILIGSHNLLALAVVSNHHLQTILVLFFHLTLAWTLCTETGTGIITVTGPWGGGGGLSLKRVGSVRRRKEI